MQNKARQTGITSVRLAQTPEEIESAQKLRYQVFYEEYGATPSQEMEILQKDWDDFDEYADHLVVVSRQDDGREDIVGTYRLLPENAAQRYGRFYTSDEYDLQTLTEADITLLEVGRSCVLPAYRTRPVLNLLWEGIAAYITEHEIDLLFGCASLPGTDLKSVETSLSYLYHFHLAPPALRPRAIEERFIDMNILPKETLDPRRAFANLPPLIKGYLRLGGSVGNGAVIDESFNSIDVCIVVQTHLITQRYRKHYERKIQKNFPESLDRQKSGNSDLDDNIYTPLSQEIPL